MFESTRPGGALRLQRRGRPFEPVTAPDANDVVDGYSMTLAYANVCSSGRKIQQTSNT
jgi:hypothetical protein